MSEVKKYLKNFDSASTFDEAFYNQLPQKSLFSEMDFLAMALVEMTKKSQDSTMEQSAGEAE